MAASFRAFATIEFRAGFVETQDVRVGDRLRFRQRVLPVRSGHPSGSHQTSS
jgi:hypothetical protein